VTAAMPPCLHTEVADVHRRIHSPEHDLPNQTGGALHRQAEPRISPAHPAQSHSNPAGMHRVSVGPSTAELQFSSPKQQLQPSPEQHVQEQQHLSSDELKPLCAPASHMHEQQRGSPVADLQLSQLLEEKRRLLRGVSAKLGETVVSSVLESALAGSAPAFKTCVAAATPAAHCERDNFTDVIASSVLRPCASQEALAPAAADLNQGTACAELRSLCASLRDSIGRKRALLHRLQSVP